MFRGKDLEQVYSECPVPLRVGIYQLTALLSNQLVRYTVSPGLCQTSVPALLGGELRFVPMAVWLVASLVVTVCV